MKNWGVYVPLIFLLISCGSSKPSFQEITESFNQGETSCKVVLKTMLDENSIQQFPVHSILTRTGIVYQKKEDAGIVHFLYPFSFTIKDKKFLEQQPETIAASDEYLAYAVDNLVKVFDRKGDLAHEVTCDHPVTGLYPGRNGLWLYIGNRVFFRPYQGEVKELDTIKPPYRNYQSAILVDGGSLVAFFIGSAGSYNLAVYDKSTRKKVYAGKNIATPVLGWNGSDICIVKGSSGNWKCVSINLGTMKEKVTQTFSDLYNILMWGTVKYIRTSQTQLFSGEENYRFSVTFTIRFIDKSNMIIREGDIFYLVKRSSFFKVLDGLIAKAPKLADCPASR